MSLNPSPGMTVTESIREGLRLIMQIGPRCPLCGRGESEVSQKEVAALTGVSEATISRFLTGKGIDTGTLDKLFEWVNARLPEFRS